jgi:hypothetical protein
VRFVRSWGSPMIPEPSNSEMRQHVRTRLSKRQLFAATGISSIRRGTGRPCIVCVRSIESPTLEREVKGPGVLGLAHPGCYKIWREESALLRNPVAGNVFFSISRSKVQ